MRKLDILVYIQGLFILLTDIEKINRVRHHRDLDDFISEIKCIEEAVSYEKNYEHATKMV